MLLSDAPKNLILTVTDISGDKLRIKRLSDMGIRKGAKLKVIRFAPLLDPILIAVDNCQIALRKFDASFITVKAVNKVGK